MLSTGAATNEALFFKGEHNEALWRHDTSQIIHKDFNFSSVKNLKDANKCHSKGIAFVISLEGIDSAVQNDAYTCL